MGTEEPRPTNGWIANKIGHSESGVSLLRRGLRSPSLRTMKTVREVFGWSISDQVSSLDELNWHEAFSEVVAEAFENEENTEGAQN